MKLNLDLPIWVNLDAKVNKCFFIRSEHLRLCGLRRITKRIVYGSHVTLGSLRQQKKYVRICNLPWL
jgi:hypothetical protein